ncbi:tannase/feruloyl esterase family alpha/beta hydrolase [Novosphingobium humi]|uniref:Tannase/feruloyl esterase family alpha/beta hydrolase n=2 Tax=Novosphingobium humi TaxID=2282397 RepID=A0ABY7TUV2_9SPHN|nr:tannase/feruloyl esterase family alpha/beta hydrolase [Novosphingobium humi]WCT77030.1 tannase/feruloyl esterase family alpha/beta hydrolase [Novosphingobium humi]
MSLFSMRSALLLTPLLAASPAMAASPAKAAPAAKSSPKAEEACMAMARENFGPGVAITSARMVAAGTMPGEMGAPPVELPAHCRVEGTINARQSKGVTYGIGFAIAMPANWQGRFLLQGGGGLNGTIRPPIGAAASGKVPALARGFAVISHDSGHKGAVFNRDFMVDQRAALDFAESSVREVALLGKAITRAYYRRPIARSYMAGCSTGGRETMLAAQRYPELFDGLVIGAPAMRTGNSNLATTYAAVTFNQAAPRDEAGLPIPAQIFSAADRKTILDGLLNQCDALDGRKDGMIANVAACHFRPAALVCAPGSAQNCLSPLQAEVLERAFQPPRDKAGHALYSPFPYDTGIVATGGGIPGFLPTGMQGPLGPPIRDLTFDPDARIEAIRADFVQGLTDTDRWTNLSGFLGHGGKVLFYHGVSDPWFSALDTWDYWQRAAAENGSAFTDASRFYMVPGMGHCGGGNAFDTFDLLGAVVDWVEKGSAPEAIDAYRRTGTDTMPLCPYPGFARYSGDPGRYSCAPR